MGGGERSSEPEPDEEESPEPSESESNRSQRAEDVPRRAGSEHEEGEWTRIGDEWVVHHRVWRRSLYSPEFRFGDPAPEE
eukprot:4856935-Alexandrium_andersonii.AAC.1